MQPVLSIIQQQRAPLLAYVSGGDLLHMRQYSKVKRKGPYHQRCNRNNKTRVSYPNRGLARRVCKDTLFLRLGAVVGRLYLPQPFAIPFLRHPAVREVQDQIFASCTLLHLAALCFNHSLLELSFRSIKPDSIIATALTLHKVRDASRA